MPFLWGGITTFIILQSQSRANPSALIGSLSVGLLQYGPCIFVLEQTHIMKQLYLKPKLRKNWRILSFFTEKLPEKAKKIDFFADFKGG